MLEDSRIQRLNAGVKPGHKAGEGILDVRVEERTPYRLFTEYNNTITLCGRERGPRHPMARKPHGNGDVLMAQ